MAQVTVASAPTRWARTQPWISLVARLVLGGVLVVAGYLKVVQSPTEQVRAVRAYELLPVGIDELVAYTLPVVEILAGIALIIGLGTRIAAVLGGLMMLAFIVGVASAWARGLTIDCGCFGGGGQVDAGETAYLQEILRDIGLVALAGWLAVLGAGRFALDTRARSRADRHTDQSAENEDEA